MSFYRCLLCYRKLARAKRLHAYLMTLTMAEYMSAVDAMGQENLDLLTWYLRGMNFRVVPDAHLESHDR